MLDALSTTFSKTLILLIKSFRLSSLFPALCFVVAHLLFILLHFSERDLLAWINDEGLGFVAFVVFLLTVLVGYTLSYLNYPIIYLFEGYPFRETLWGRMMRAWYREQREWLEQQAQAESRQRARVDSEADSNAWTFYEDRLADRFPPRGKDCAPTELGNVIAAFEDYPSSRYGIDAVHMWSRILPILDERGYAVFVEREKEGFDFFLNFSLLSGVLAMESTVMRWLADQPVFTGIALVSLCAAFLFYHWGAVNCARNWGETIKTAFDLYRYDLAEKLALRPFTDEDDEMWIWWVISSLVKRGSLEELYKVFDYFLLRNMRGGARCGDEE